MTTPPRTQSIQRLLELSQHQLDKISQTLRTAHQNQQSAQQQLQQLEHYHLEYAQRLSLESRAGLSTTNYRNFLRFINTLETAISEQNNRVALLSAQRSEIQQQWQTLRQRCKAYETLIEREQQAKQQAANRHEQRHNDEMANQLAQRAQAPLS
ncbi:MAG TPA: flagellar export protein FliJ [Paenalcaligenes sp.]|nr:flagellar export protein FliJ [Paenalcaligenes sp.]